MRWLSAWLVASSVALLAGCGGSSAHSKQPVPKIPAVIAQQLAADADALATQPGCQGHDAATKLLNDLIANLKRIPARYQEPLTTAANDLAARLPACAPPKREHGHGKPKHKHDHGKHGGDGGD